MVRFRARTSAAALMVLGAIVILALSARGIDRAPSRALVTRDPGAANVVPFGAPGSPTVGYPTKLTDAAVLLEERLTAGGVGIQFETVQRNTINARVDGPKVPVVDSSDPRKVVGETDRAYINAMTSVGAIAPDAFWMDLYVGPADGEKADLDRQPLVWQVIERGGLIWRNDGAGWYATDVSPGMGIDPATARTLVRLLRGQSETEVLAPAVLGEVEVDGIRGRSKIADFPGVVASDGASFTEAAFRVEFWFAEDGRLVQLVARAKNLNEDTYDLVSETVITLIYEPAGSPPEPLPRMGPEPTPIPDPADQDSTDSVAP